jgi:transcription elongation GreA/GreB family factor
MSFTIVGEDGADRMPAVSWVSPLAYALGSARSATVVWKRPTGDRELEITRIQYPKH